MIISNNSAISKSRDMTALLGGKWCVFWNDYLLGTAIFRLYFMSIFLSSRQKWRATPAHHKADIVKRVLRYFSTAACTMQAWYYHRQHRRNIYAWELIFRQYIDEMLYLFWASALAACIATNDVNICSMANNHILRISSVSHRIKRPAIKQRNNVENIFISYFPNGYFIYHARLGEIVYFRQMAKCHLSFEIEVNNGTKIFNAGERLFLTRANENAWDENNHYYQLRMRHLNGYSHCRRRRNFDRDNGKH